MAQQKQKPAEGKMKEPEGLQAQEGIGLAKAHLLVSRRVPRKQK
jgi:hypothetical protein